MLLRLSCWSASHTPIGHAGTQMLPAVARTRPRARQMMTTRQRESASVWQQRQRRRIKRLRQPWCVSAGLFGRVTLPTSLKRAAALHGPSWQSCPACMSGGFSSREACGVSCIVCRADPWAGCQSCCRSLKAERLLWVPRCRQRVLAARSCSWSVTWSARLPSLLQKQAPTFCSSFLVRAAANPLRRAGG